MIETRIRCDVKDCDAFETIVEFGGVPAGWHVVSFVEYKLRPPTPNVRDALAKAMRNVAPPEVISPLMDVMMGRPVVELSNPMSQSPFTRHVCPKHPMPAFDAVSEG